MSNNFELSFEKVNNFMGDISTLNKLIEYSINELLTSYFVTSNHRKDEFMRFMQYRWGLSYRNKIDCLRFIADSIKDKTRREQFDLTIMFAMRFNMVKEKLVYGWQLNSDPETIIIRTINEIYRYQDIEVSQDYIDSMRRTALDTISELDTAKQYFDENT